MIELVLTFHIFNEIVINSIYKIQQMNFKERYYSQKDVF
jgi:hypothetical protein